MDVIFHTSTLQAGVDYSVSTADTFDSFIHVYTGMSSTADQFVQSTLRCRNWKNKEHIMYIRQGSEHGAYMLTPNQTFKFLNKLYSKTNMMYNRLTDQLIGLRALLIARENMLTWASQDYIINSMRMLGFNLEFEENRHLTKHHIRKTIINGTCPIVKERLEITKEFIEDYIMKKKQFIKIDE